MIEKEILEYIFVCVDYKHKNDISSQITKAAIDKENLLFENAVSFLRNLDTENKVFLKVSEQTEKLTQDLIQSEFGYNKANEWHYVKDGDLPNTEFSRVDVTVAYINAYENPCKMDCCFDGTNFIYWDSRKPVGWKKVDIFGKIYAWKYQERLPELPNDLMELAE